ncbi:transcription factor [Ganoderma sinense ZZ0214-1]|uniref:Transcription factor n=1 Tax=Ganoderma sinense ZZ0214-1 TaxID=1077348 RepID=A0A2G8SSE6_9APHY|nr:transcription factor [Ganoderma sinense ZZ0214-1]
MPATQSPNSNGHLPAVAASGPPSGSVPRTKQVRVRSPGPGANSRNDAVDSGGLDARPPPKRARKAINCEPCRNSKLKCDRNRPCSSCVLRGTTSLCYQGQDADPSFRGHVDQQRPVDAAAEFARIRHSLNLLEQHVGAGNPNFSRVPPHGYPPEPMGRGSLPPNQPPPYDTNAASRLSPEPEGYSHDKEKAEDVDMTSTPGMLGQQASGGLYSGPTSAASHLISPSDRDDIDNQNDRPMSPPSPKTRPRAISDPVDHGGSTGDWDQDLTAQLPDIHMIDGLIEYYFEYCNWVYRHVNEPALLAGWDRYKKGKHGDRLILATVCILIALAARYLPPRHALLQGMSETCEELGSKCYGIMRVALDRYRKNASSPGRSYSLELVELLLVRSHYLTFAKEDPEETWSVRGELVTIGTAMGLHRDPGSTRFEKTVAERRRWAWWHIVLLERWQAFMFGRPLAIASQHFNTQLPTYCDPALDKSQRLFLPNIALFKLAFVLGDIMDDAVSFRAVPYSSVQERDKMLTEWYEALPSELDLDEYRIARSLASPITSVRRLGVQSVIIRTAYHHIRFTLHRPYAKVPESLEIAVSAASQLIALVGQTRPDFLSNTALAVPGHMNWGPFHVFSAAMFFSFQLITKPDQPAASLFRENIRKSIASLEQSRWMPVADKALTILQALAPLYSDDLLEVPREEAERKKAQTLSLVRTLAFPYQDAPYSRSADSPGYSRYDAAAFQASAQPNHNASSYPPRAESGQRTAAVTTPQSQAPPPPPPHPTQPPVSATRWTSQSQPELSSLQYAQQPLQPPYTPHRPSSNNISTTPTHGHVPQAQLQQYSPTVQTSGQSFPMVRYATQQAEVMQQPLPHHQHMFRDNGQGGAAGELAYIHPADESAMWGASIGFGLSEWNQFVDHMQRPDTFTPMVQGPTH